MKEYFSYRIFIILIICSGNSSTKQVSNSHSLRKYMLRQSTNLLAGYLDIISLPLDGDPL